METIWIIGLGRFGLHAVKGLSKGRRDRHFVLVDPDPEHLKRGEGPGRTLERSDGVAFVTENLSPDSGPDWIIPALPVHLAAEWCLARLGSDRARRATLPREIEPLLPNPMRGHRGDIYVTHAEFQCPGDCPEPRDICTVTGKKRKRNMFEVLAKVGLTPWRSLVIRSRQLGPGIGGYRPSQLFDLLSDVEKSAGQLLVSTACRCHGVITGMERF